MRIFVLFASVISYLLGFAIGRNIEHTWCAAETRLHDEKATLVPAECWAVTYFNKFGETIVATYIRQESDRPMTISLPPRMTGVKIYPQPCGPRLQ